MKLTMEIETRRYFPCPNGCAHRFYIEHLFGLPGHSDDVHAGPWYCDVCGQGWSIVAHRAGGVDVEKRDVLRKTWVTLEIPAGSPAIRFRVRGACLGDADPTEGNEFYYNEGTCPTNWLRDVVEVEVGGDRDPHGFARYVETVRVEDATDVCHACGGAIAGWCSCSRSAS